MCSSDLQPAVPQHPGVADGRLSRVLRLHGRRPLPRYFDIDDGLDAVLTGPAGATGGRPPRH